MTAGPNGAYVLHGPFGDRKIPKSEWIAQTANVLFDGLFAMAQDDLRQDSVEAIRDDAFDQGQPIPCHCFETGAKWHYVWTRDLAYAIDLGLWRFDPARSRNGLLFKLSGVRAQDVPSGLYPMQDTGSGGSWPVSTDRVVWFLGARHLLDDKAFADKVWQALNDTLAQDREYAYDAHVGLYRGETSFLDWREQSYPEWTQDNVVWIAQSFALSTNVLHYEALRLAARMASRRRDARAEKYAEQADALKQAINAHLWHADRGMYLSYIGGDGLPVEAYDLLGLSLAITSGVADTERARLSLGHYPVWPAGSPVIWPERADEPIYHNRAIWPFVSAYALRAARKVDDPALIASTIESLMRGAALAGSNMENYELVTQATHVDDGKFSGPVVDSKRQLWSVAGYLDMVLEGVFGLEDDGSVVPKIPVELVPMLFGKDAAIALQLSNRKITLQRPRRIDGNLLVADSIRRDGAQIVVTLKSIQVPALDLRTAAPIYAPPTPPTPVVTHAGDEARVAGAWPRTWTASANGEYRVWLDYANGHGPINTGITAAVKRLVIRCDGSAEQTAPIVMPHSVGEQRSTTATFAAKAGAHCTFALKQGFNMSDLANFAHYTGGEGGSGGPLNAATIGELHIESVPAAKP
ncbi:MAG: Six-hairpin glycosidase-like protein [Xanthomonadaceae bacterium]|nr:Six-hairpin glycosidase-like protein [Xanthomonadaceae bacterium]MDE2083769.1 Six-hairpin glycosidase-like protein [Xanthomonadaceae bacterium]